MRTVFVVACVLAGLTSLDTISAAKQSCPLAADIVPCLCLQDESMELVMDCSGVTDEPELANVFTSYFPTTDFYELRIFHDPANPDHQLYSLEELTLGNTTFRRVNITGTHITKIHGYAFDKSRSTLEVLSLNGNKINRFIFGSLSRYPSLSTVLLAYNNLTLLPDIESPYLKILDMSGNNPLVIEENAFAKISSLQKVNLSNTNQQEVNPNFFTELEELQEIDLSNNALRKLEEAVIVTAKPSITNLDLSKNEISFIRHDSIQGLSSNATLSLESNNITLLTQLHWQHIFDQIERPYGVINLAENPLLCGCDMAWIVLNDAYLPLLTDTTTCVSGEMVIFLDPNVFILMC